MVPGWSLQVRVDSWEQVIRSHPSGDWVHRQQNAVSVITAKDSVSLVKHTLIGLCLHLQASLLGPFAESSSRSSAETPMGMEFNQWIFSFSHPLSLLQDHKTIGAFLLGRWQWDNSQVVAVVKMNGGVCGTFSELTSCLFSQEVINGNCSSHFFFSCWLKSGNDKLGSSALFSSALQKDIVGFYYSLITPWTMIFP